MKHISKPTLVSGDAVVCQLLDLYAKHLKGNKKPCFCLKNNVCYSEKNKGKKVIFISVAI